MGSTLSVSLRVGLFCCHRCRYLINLADLSGDRSAYDVAKFGGHVLDAGRGKANDPRVLGQAQSLRTGLTSSPASLT